MGEWIRLNNGCKHDFPIVEEIVAAKARVGSEWKCICGTTLKLEYIAQDHTYARWKPDSSPWMSYSR